MGVFRRESSAPEPAKFSAFRPLTAAAAQIKLTDKSEADQFKSRRNSSVALWQAEAWEYYDAIAEVKYAFNLVASIVSRVRIYAAVTEADGEAPIPTRNSETLSPLLSDAAQRAVDRLDSAYGGQAGLLRDAALNLSVTGECYLVQVPSRPGHNLPETWDIRSVDELQVNAQGKYCITPRRDLIGAGSSGNKPGTIELPAGAFMGRIWRPHPRFSEEPDSSMRGLLDLCAELLLLNRTFQATEKSRLNAGAFFVPDGLSMASSADPDEPYDAEGNPLEQSIEEVEDDFEDQLLDAMITPIEDVSSAAAVAPLIIRGPTELGKELRVIKFERSFDEALITRSDRVLDRILQGLDVPKDVVTGLANVKYSNAIQIDESFYKAHIEPMLLLICDALTMIFLRPYLKSVGYNEAEVNRIAVWFDASSVATRNDRAADADSGYEKLAISGDTWRRAHGFSAADAPTPTEMILRLVQQAPSLTPELTEALLTAFAPEVMQAARTAAQANSVAPVPPEVQNALSGQPAATDPTATPAAPAEDTAAPVDTAPEAPVEAGQDAPPVPLAEPTQ